MTGPLVVWGAGAIGGTIGAALARAGEDVLFVDRAADHVAAINSRGLEIVGPVDPHLVTAKAVTSDAIEGTYERILLCVKAHDTEAAARSLLPHLATEGYVVSVQNGLNERVIADVVGRERTIGSFVNFGADYMEPGVVEFAGRGAVVVGELDGQPNAEDRRAACALLPLRRCGGADRQHLGFPLVEDDLRRTPLRHRGDQ